ncbi:MAG: nuclear transport factor 2 family protein [Moheibacter sp.]
MNKLLIPFFTMIFSFATAQTTEEKEVQSVIENMFEDVFSKLDENLISKYFTDDFLLFEDGEVYNLETTTQMVATIKKQFDDEAAKGHKLERKNKFEFIKILTDGNSAQLYYKNAAEIFYDGMSIMKFNWLESASLTKSDGNWKISFLHSTMIKNKEDSK